MVEDWACSVLNSASRLFGHFAGTVFSPVRFVAPGPGRSAGAGADVHRVHRLVPALHLPQNHCAHCYSLHREYHFVGRLPFHWHSILEELGSAYCAGSYRTHWGWPRHWKVQYRSLSGVG